MTDWRDYIISGSVSKTIQDAAWQLNFDVEERWILPLFTTSYSVIREDHNGTNRRIFFGFIPAGSAVHQTAAHNMNVAMVDFGWYLSRQKVQGAVIKDYLDSDPALIIEQLLGGANSGNVTGVGEYTLYTNPDWSTTQKTFQWTTETSKWDAIQEMCTYTGYVFHMLWSAEGETPLYAKAYYVKASELDDGKIDLPAAVTVTNPSDEVISLTYIENQTDMINEVVARGFNSSSNTYFIATQQSTPVAAGEECPVTYNYKDLGGGLDTWAKTEAKALSLFTDLYSVPATYKAVFKRRYDLQLYQKITFSGYSGITTDAMRITAIQYNFGIANETVEIQCSPIDSLTISNPEQVARSMDTNIITEEGLVAEDRIRRLPVASIATVTDISGNLMEVNFKKESDKTVWVQRI